MAQLGNIHPLEKREKDMRLVLSRNTQAGVALSPARAEETVALMVDLVRNLKLELMLGRKIQFDSTNSVVEIIIFVSVHHIRRLIKQKTH